MSMKAVVELLEKEPERNLNILNFIEAYPIHSYEIAGSCI